MKSICIYLGAHGDHHSTFSEAIPNIAQQIISRGLTLVYGGSSLGLMGQLAETVKAHGSKIIGIIPQVLIDQEIPPPYLDELHVVESMQARKQMMQQKSDMFLVMPGGIGTLEEAFDTWNAIKIGIFDKPIGFLNLNGYFDDLFSFIRNCTQHGLITEKHAAIPIIHSDINILLAQLTKC